METISDEWRARALAQRARAVVARLGRRVAVALIVGSLSLGAGALGADGNEEPRLKLTIEKAVGLALRQHPRMKEAEARLDAARANVAAARADQLPRAGISLELNRSTGNAVPGAFIQMAGIPSVSGSPRGRDLNAGVWESGAAVWADWNATGLAGRMKRVDAALAARAGAEAELREQRLELAFEVSDAYLSVLAAEEDVRASQASLERARTFATVVKALVAQSLRPGADAARVDADVAVALTQVARAEEARATRVARLAELIGMPERRLELDPGGLLRPVGNAPPPAVGSPASHPLVQARAALAESAGAVARAARFEYLPRVDLVAELWARGSGFYPGSPDFSGALPDTANWLGGVLVSWPFLDIPLLKARVRAADARSAAALARKDEATLAVTGQLEQASRLLEGARRVARNTPVALASARVAETQAVARYRASLSSILDVADAQRVLAQAELDDALARLQVRRALLYLSRAGGDLAPFLADATRTRGPP